MLEVSSSRKISKHTHKRQAHASQRQRGRGRRRQASRAADHRGQWSVVAQRYEGCNKWLSARCWRYFSRRAFLHSRIARRKQRAPFVADHLASSQPCAQITVITMRSKRKLNYKNGNDLVGQLADAWQDSSAKISGSGDFVFQPRGTLQSGRASFSCMDTETASKNGDQPSQRGGEKSDRAVFIVWLSLQISVSFPMKRE